MPVELTPKQKRFCEEYIIDLNGSQSAIRAGYSQATSRSIANELLTKLDIQEYIQELMQERSKRTEITADKVLNELAHIAFDDIRNYLRFYTDAEGNVRTEIKDSDKVDTRAISEVSQGKDGQFKFKVYCKDNALVQLGKHLGLFVDRVESNNTNTNYNKDISNMSLEEIQTELAEKYGYNITKK